jgi:hypothetical protein
MGDATGGVNVESSQITDLGTGAAALVPASATDDAYAPGGTVGAVNPGGVPPQLFTVNG